MTSMPESPESTQASSSYEPPRIELELTDEQLTREVQYAAYGGSQPPTE